MIDQEPDVPIGAGAAGPKWIDPTRDPFMDAFLAQFARALGLTYEDYVAAWNAEQFRELVGYDPQLLLPRPSKAGAYRDSAAHYRRRAAARRPSQAEQRRQDLYTAAWMDQKADRLERGGE